MLQIGNFPPGESLALDTPFPTPGGLVPLGEIKTGDTIYDEYGQRRRVEEAFPVLLGRPCYRITFDDGTSLVADAGHKWLVETPATRQVPNMRNHARRRTQGTRRVKALQQVDELLRATDDSVLTTLAEFAVTVGRNQVTLYKVLAASGVEPAERRRVATRAKPGPGRTGPKTRLQAYYRTVDLLLGMRRHLEANAYDRTDLRTVAPVVLTTEEIAATVKYRPGPSRGPAGRRHGLQNRYSIPLAAPLDAPDADLPLHPYVLGVWLGDGTSCHADFTCHVDDVDAMVANVNACGVTTSVYKPPKRDDIRTVRLGPLPNACRRGHPRTKPGKCQPCDTLRHRAKAHGEPMPPATYETVRAILRRTGLMNNKHIPEAYFQASPAQRLALLQGLMDTDGTCGTNGHIELALNNERLARQAQRLILSLGHKVRMTSRLETHGKGVGSTNYRMTWTAPDPVFRLPRKLARQKIATAGWSRRRFIVSVEPVPSVPVRCLCVSGPSHLFLVGEECVATHNSMKTAEAR